MQIAFLGVKEFLSLMGAAMKVGERSLEKKETMGKMEYFLSREEQRREFTNYR
jgi:hypothetical protein